MTVIIFLGKAERGKTLPTLTPQTTPVSFPPKSQKPHWYPINPFVHFSPPLDSQKIHSIHTTMFQNIVSKMKQISSPVSTPKSPVSPLNVSHPLGDKFRGSLLGCALGDSLGYFNGKFEFCPDTLKMHRKIAESHPEGQASVKHLDLENWRVSDDTVMHLATMRALISFEKKKGSSALDGVQPSSSQSHSQQSEQEGITNPYREFVDEIMQEMAARYIECWSDMPGRAPGATCAQGVHFLERHGIDQWEKYPYSKSGGGCGGSMRAMGIGLRFFGDTERQRHHLVAVSIESGRLTHNHPVGYLGAMCSAVFTALALEGQVPIERWPNVLLKEFIPRAQAYLRDEAQRDWDKIKVDMNAFVSQWETFIEERGLTEENNFQPKYANSFCEDPTERDAYYKKYSYSGWFGASGDDSVIVAYDCLLASRGDYDKCVHWACFNAGDSDSIGAIALSWYGALYGACFPPKNLEHLEKKDELEQQAKDLWDLVNRDAHMKEHGLLREDM